MERRWTAIYDSRPPAANAAAAVISTAAGSDGSTAASGANGRNATAANRYARRRTRADNGEHSTWSAQHNQLTGRGLPTEAAASIDAVGC